MTPSSLRPLGHDFTRCYGDGCHEKEHCLRYLTMRVDLPAHVFKYTLSLRNYSIEPCKEKLDGDVSDQYPV
jgi:hypothetical protein